MRYVTLWILLFLIAGYSPSAAKEDAKRIDLSVQGGYDPKDVTQADIDFYNEDPTQFSLPPQFHGVYSLSWRLQPFPARGGSCH